MSCPDTAPTALHKDGDEPDNCLEFRGAKLTVMPKRHFLEKVLPEEAEALKVAKAKEKAQAEVVRKQKMAMLKAEEKEKKKKKEEADEGKVETKDRKAEEQKKSNNVINNKKKRKNEDNEEDDCDMIDQEDGGEGEEFDEGDADADADVDGDDGDGDDDDDDDGDNDEDDLDFVHGVVVPFSIVQKCSSKKDAGDNQSKGDAGEQEQDNNLEDTANGEENGKKDEEHDVSREDLQEIFQKFGRVQYIAFHRGKECGHVQFQDPVSATKSAASKSKAEDDSEDKLVDIGGKESWVLKIHSILEGDEETAYWKDVQRRKRESKKLLASRGRSKGRGGGRGGGRGRGRGASRKRGHGGGGGKGGRPNNKRPRAGGNNGGGGSRGAKRKDMFKRHVAGEGKKDNKKARTQ